MTEAELAARVGRHLAAMRRQRGYTQMHLSALSQVEQATIARIEKGIVNPTVSTLCKLANALQVDVIEFFR